MIDDVRRCFKCGYELYAPVNNCPRCGAPLHSSKRVRVLGWVLLVLGLFLVVFMGIITYNLAPGMLNPGVSAPDRSVFTGTKEQGQQFLGLFALVILVGITCVVSGIWQITTGRRNKKIAYFGIGLVLLLALIGKFILWQAER